MAKQQTKDIDGINKSIFYSRTIKHLIKNPLLITVTIILIVIIIEVTGHILFQKTQELLPFFGRGYDAIVESLFGIPVILLAVHYIRKYLVAKEIGEETEAEYANVVNSIKEVVFQTDSNGAWRFLNPAWTEITGFSIEESLDRSFIDFVHPDDRESNLQLFKPLIEGKKEFCRHEIRYLTKDAGYCWMEVFARLDRDAEGKITGTAGTLMDITERKYMEQELRQREQMLMGVSEATAILLFNTELETALNNVLKVLGEATGADRVYIFQDHIDKNTGKLLVSGKYEWCNRGVELRLQGQTLKGLDYDAVGFKRWREGLAEGRVICGAVSQFPISERSLLEGQGIKALAVVPIFTDNHHWGFMGFDDCTSERSWSASELVLLKTVAASIGAAIKRVEDESQLQQLLENDYKHTLQNLQNLVFKCKKDEAGGVYFTLFEGGLTEGIGFATEAVFGRSPEEVFRHDTNNYEAQQYERAFKGEICSFEMHFNNRIFYTSLSPIIYKNEVTEIVGSSIDITDLKAAEEQVRYMAYYDALTGLPNRLFFKEQLSYLISHANRNKEQLAIMFLDLDRFKNINDTLGHKAGDELLKQTALRLKEALKEQVIVVRMGGDEFIVAFPDLGKESNISRLAQEIIDAFKEPFNIGGHDMYISTSIGISLYPHDGVDIDNLIKNADIAMYRAKDNGRNNYQFYTEDMNKKALERLELENHLRRALEKKELFILYQPRVHTFTGKIVGAEALLRWRHPRLGLISPTDFIPIAEEIGAIHEIGKWVLKSAIKQAKEWANDGAENLKVSVNISAVQFQREDLLDSIKQVVSEAQMDPYNIELEITENTIMHKTSRTLSVIRELKDMGINISIDDFGTGFSSLSYIKEFNLDILKIDKSFILDIGQSPTNESIITAIINMAHSMGMKVVAEGVETIEHMEFLESKRCDEVQGYLLSRPIPPEELLKLIIKNSDAKVV